MGPLRARPGVHANRDHTPPPLSPRPGPPAGMDDLAYLVNQVQERVPPIMHAHARYADNDGKGEPTVLVINTDSGEVLWRVPLTGLLTLAARFLRLNPQLVIGPPRRDEADGRQPRRARPTMNDLAYLVNRVQEPRRPVLQAHAQFIDGVDGAEPTVQIINSATSEVVQAFPLKSLLRLAASFKLNTGLVFQGQA